MENLDNSVNNENNSKLNLIKTEITNKNYARRDFMNFCLFKKNNGDNIDNWTMDELSSLVNEFQQNNNPQEEIDNDIYDEENEIEDNYFENEIENEDIKMTNLCIEQEENNKINDRALDLSNSERHTIRCKKGSAEKIIKCQTLQKTVLNDKKIVINLKDPKEINGGLFSSNYILYSVETQPMGWVVQRRDSDFDLLRKLLLKYYPFHKIDPLPNKKNSAKRFKEDFIQKRIKHLNDFINNIIKNEVFKASDILVSFLSLEDKGQFVNKFKELNNQNYEIDIDQYKTFKGKLIILHDEKNEKYFSNIYTYLNLQNEAFIKLNENLKSFYKNMNEATKNINEIINNFDILYKINTNVSMKGQISNSYKELKNIFIGLKNIYHSQNQIIKTRIKDYFKYINLSNNSFKEILEKREELNTKFINENKKLRYKKEKLFIYGDINKFEIDQNQHIDFERLIKDKRYTISVICTNETKKILQMYKVLGYANKMAKSEMRKMIGENCKKYNENLNLFREEFNSSIKDFNQIWNNFELFLNNKIERKRKNNENKVNKNDIESNSINRDILNNFEENINFDVNNFPRKLK